MSGILSIVGTPIGNLDDLSPRAARTLAAADIIACEDTRVAKTLLTRAPSRAKLVAYHARNERERTAELVRAIAAGKRVALTTDAGMPGTSDPGQRLVEACARAGLRIEVVPGPSAVPAALIASGLPIARFVFEGFLPRTGSARRRRIEALRTETRTVVLFESPHRVAATLEDLARALGPRRAALARELTKVHEEVVRGTLEGLAEQVRGAAVRGECTLVIEGVEPVATPEEPDELAREVAERVEQGMSRRDAVTAVAAERGIPKGRVYDAAIRSGEP